ncbi:MAG: hypothetical protein SFU83_14795 [Meiothermus sp.]|nr:hypothetical protein [Meiothermus sp.]
MKHLPKLISIALLALLAACTQTPAPAPTLAVSPKTLSFSAGDVGKPVTATLTGSSEAITWSLSPAGTGTLSASTGTSVTYTPPANVAAATTVTLTATSSGVSDSATITVNPQPAIGVSPKTRTVVAGSAATAFTVTLSTAKGTITWSLSPNLGSLSATTGTSVNYTPPANVAAATTVTLTATSSGVSDSATITISPLPTLTVSPNTRTIVAGSAATSFSAILANSAETITWNLSPSLGTLSANTGSLVEYTPPTTVASSTEVTLTASAGSLSASATITVNPFVNSAGEGRNITLQNWPAGSSGTLNFTSVVSGSFTQTPVASTSINATGQFSYNLAAATVLGPISGTFPSNCGLDVVNPSPGAQIANGVINAVEGSNPQRSVRIANNATAPVGAPVIGYASASLMYSNAAWSVTGTCTTGGSTNTYALNLVQGWNWFIITTNSATSQTFSTATTLPAGFNWYY